MIQSTPSYLRLHVEAFPAHGQPPLDLYHRLADICVSFERATGWPLYFDALPAGSDDPELLWSAPLSAGGQRLGHLRIELTRSKGPKAAAPIDLDSATDLADELVQLLNEQLHTQHVVWLREAELATGVPVVARADEPQHVAERLEAVLKAGAEAVGCQSAGLYLLDAHTTELKLRSAWGLPRRRLCDPPRSLETATADLEALAGHAVVLEKRDMAEFWHVPEPFAAAVCVPVSTPTVPLGTLWLFSQEQRTFHDREMNLIEIVAGRMATELERQTLLVESRRGSQLNRRLATAQQIEHDRANRVAPLIEGWELAGWSHAARDLSGAFYHWQALADGTLALAVGDSSQPGIAAALVSQTVRAALRAHAGYGPPPQRLLERVNADLWSESSGDLSASLWFANVDPVSGLMRYAAAGHPRILRLQTMAFESLGEPQLALGLEPATRYVERCVTLAPAEAIVVCNDQASAALHDSATSFEARPIGERLAARLDQPAADLAELMRAAWETQVEAESIDAAVLVVKRL